MEPNNLDSVEFLVDMISCLKNFSKASFANLYNVFELLLKSTSIKDVIQRRLFSNLTKLSFKK